MAQRVKWSRCEQCGKRLLWEATCRDHPEADRIAWKRPLQYAWYYVARAASEGTEIEPWIERVPDGDITGCSRVDLAIVLAYAERWGNMPELQMQGLPIPEVKPDILFGPRR